MDQTTPESGVAQPDLEAALETQFGFGDEPEKPVPAQESPADQASDELTADDLPEVTDDEAAPQSASDDVYEIIHNGQPVKLTRDELTLHAQQGFDYTRKSQALAEQAKNLQQQFQRVQQIEQIQVQLAPDLAQVKALEQQLGQYQNIDWAKAHAENPLEAPGHFAQYQMLKDAYQQAMGQVHQKANAIQQQKQALTAQTVQQQKAKLLEMLPAWSDPAKYQQGAQEVRDYLLKLGVDEQTVGSVNDARSVAVAWKALQWDKLQQAKTEKVKQLRAAPPVVKPGAASQQPDGKAQFKQFREKFVTAGRKGNSRAQEGLLEQRLSRVFK